jgi:ribosomal protein L11 methyltransferase
MRQIVIRIPRIAVEDVLDRLLPLLSEGVRERQAGHHVELIVRGRELPERDELERALGRWPHLISEQDVSDDWRERRRADWEEDVIANRLVVRPEWAPPARPGLIAIELEESAAFGVGGHPTTRTCLELLLAMPPGGAFADLGCGTGVLAILAARLGWRPVTAIDLQPAAVAATDANARRNGVQVTAVAADLSAQPPPAAEGFAANVPAPLHHRLAASWSQRPPRAGVLSGFSPAEADGVVAAYAAAGLQESRRLERGGWTIVEVRR